LAIATQSFYKQQLRQRFELLAGERYSRIAERFQEQEQRLDGLRRFFDFSNEITPASSTAMPACCCTAPRRIPGRRGWKQGSVKPSSSAPAVCLRSATRSVTRCARRLAGGPARDHYYPVLYNQASSQQGQPYGLDLLGQPKRAATLARAMAPGSMAVSEPLDMLSVDPAYSRGLLMVAPVFAESAPAGGPPSGYVMALLSLRQLIVESLPTVADDNLVVRILDPSTDAGHEVLFDSGNQVARMALASTHLLHLADHHYQLDIRPSVVSWPPTGRRRCCVVGCSAVCSACCWRSCFTACSASASACPDLVARRTTELRISEQSLRKPTTSCAVCSTPRPGGDHRHQTSRV
jgi:CHASE1-domain containing sensor protein